MNATRADLVAAACCTGPALLPARICPSLGTASTRADSGRSARDRSTRHTQRRRRRDHASSAIPEALPLEQSLARRRPRARSRSAAVRRAVSRARNSPRRTRARDRDRETWPAARAASSAIRLPPAQRNRDAPLTRRARAAAVSRIRASSLPVTPSMCSTSSRTGISCTTTGVSGDGLGGFGTELDPDSRGQRHRFHASISP